MLPCTMMCGAKCSVSEALPADVALDAWMAAIADAGWHRATLADAARAAVLAPRELALAGDRHDAAGRLADQALREAFLAAAGEGHVRERLFDGLMAGLDVLQAHRPAVLAMWRARDPGLLLLVSRRLPAGARRLASAAGMATGGWKGPLRLMALSAMGADLFRHWLRDDSADMAATMAALDRLLDRAEKLETEGVSLRLLGLPGLTNPFRRAPAPAPGLPPE